MGSLQIEYRSPSELKPYAKNPRVRTDAQIDQIAASIENFGFVNPILIDETGGIIAGHGRHAAAKKLKLDKVPVVVLAGLTPEQRCALTVADNKIALNAQWDDKLLLAELSSIGIGLLPATGFSLGDVGSLAGIGKLSFDDPPETVEQNAEEIARIHAARKKANVAVQTKNDTEKYLVIVFPTRDAREAELRRLGLPEDERYIDAAIVNLTLRFSADAADVEPTRKLKTAPMKRAGANG